jgi:hypothetical protein
MGGRRRGGPGSGGLWLARAAGVALALSLASCVDAVLPDGTVVDPARAIGSVVPEVQPPRDPAVPAPPPSPPVPMASPPGEPVYDADVAGVGACAESTLSGVIAQVHAAWPQLGDVHRLYQPRAGRIGGDGSAVHAFAGPRGFALAFRRGGGDCPAGCTENEYWYFTTDERCAAAQVGHYRAGWESGTCLSTAGAPLWGVPAAPDPRLVCQGGTP